AESRFKDSEMRRVVLPLHSGGYVGVVATRNSRVVIRKLARDKEIYFLIAVAFYTIGAFAFRLHSMNVVLGAFGGQKRSPRPRHDQTAEVVRVEEIGFYAITRLLEGPINNPVRRNRGLHVLHAVVAIVAVLEIQR